MQFVTAAITFIAGLLIGFVFQFPTNNLISYQWSHRFSGPTFTPQPLPPQPLTLPPTEDFIPPPEFLQQPYCGYRERDSFINVQLSNLSDDPAPGDYFVDVEGRIISCVAPPWPESGWQMRWFKTQRWSREHVQPWLSLLLELFALAPSYVWQLCALACAVTVTAFLCSRQASRVARGLRIEVASRNARVKEEEDLKEVAQQELEHTQRVLSDSTKEIEKLHKGFTEQKEDFQTQDKDKTAEITDLKRELGRADYTLDPARAVGIPEVDAQVQRLPTLKAREEEYRRLFYGMKADLIAKDEELLRTKDQVQKLAHFLAHLKRQISNLKTERDDALTKKRAAQDERSIVAMESEPLVEENSKLKKDVKELKAMLNGMETELTSLRPMHAELLKDNERLSAQVSTLEKKAAAPVEQKEESTELQDRVNKLSAKLNRRDIDFSTLELINAATLKANEHLTTQVSDLEKKATASTKHLQESIKLQDQVTDLKARVNDKEAEITSLKSQSSIISNENENLTARVLDLEKDLAAQTSRRDAIQRQLETRSNVHLKSLNEKSALEHELSQVRARRDEEANAQVATLESRVQELQEQVKTLVETVSDEQGQKKIIGQDYKALQADKQAIDISYAELRAQHQQLQRQSQAAVKSAEGASTPQKPASEGLNLITNPSEPRISRGTPPSTLESSKGQSPPEKLSLLVVEAQATPSLKTSNGQYIATPDLSEQDRTNPPQPLVTLSTTEVPPLGAINEPWPSTYTLKDYISANPRPQAKTNATKEYKEQAQYRHLCWRCGGQGHTGAHCGVWKAQGAFLRLKDRYVPTLCDVAELERRILGELCFVCGAADHNHNEQKCASSAQTVLNPAAATFNPSAITSSSPAITTREAAATQHDPAQKSTPSGPRKLLEEVQKYPHVPEEELYSRVYRKLCLYCGASGHNDKLGTCPQRHANVATTVPVFAPPQQQAFHFSVPRASSSFNFDTSITNAQPAWNPFANIGGVINGATPAPQSEFTRRMSVQTNKTPPLFTNLREDASQAEPVKGAIADTSSSDPSSRIGETEDARPKNAKSGAVESQSAQKGTIEKSQAGEGPELTPDQIDGEAHKQAHTTTPGKTNAAGEVQQKPQLGQYSRAPVLKVDETNSELRAAPVTHEGSKTNTTASTPVLSRIEQPTTPKKQLGGKPSKWADPDYVPKHSSKSGDVKASPPCRIPADIREPAVKAPVAPVASPEVPVKEAVSHTTLPGKSSPPPEVTRPEEVKDHPQSTAQQKHPIWEPDMTSKWARSSDGPGNSPKPNEKAAKPSSVSPGQASNAKSATQPIAFSQPPRTQPVNLSARPGNTGVPAVKRGGNRRTPARGRGRDHQGAGRGKIPVAGQNGFDRTTFLAELASRNAASEKRQ